MASGSNTSSNQTFAYIQQMLIELRQMSEKQDAPVLAYLIEMAIIEAKDMSDPNFNASSAVSHQERSPKQLLSS